MGSSSTIARRFGLLLALTVTVGFISSFISRGNCEAHAAGEIAHGLRASLGVSDRQVYVLPDDGDPVVRYPGSEQILRREWFHDYALPAVRTAVRLLSMGGRGRCDGCRPVPRGCLVRLCRGAAFGLRHPDGLLRVFWLGVPCARARGLGDITATSSHQRPTTNDQRPTTNGQRPTTNDSSALQSRARRRKD